MSRFSRSGFLVCLLTFVGCAQPAPPPTPTPEPDTRPADEAAIQAAVKEWSAAAQAKDPDKFASYYADDGVLMLENSVYSVISPEGCASILWKDSTQAPKAAEALKLTAPRLLELGVIDGIVREPLGGAQLDHEAAAAALKEAIVDAFSELAEMSAEALVEERYQKFARIGSVG